MERNRRRFLKLAGIATLGATAGCSTSTRQSTQAATTTVTSQFDYGAWFDGTDNFDGTTVDMRGQSSVTISVGAEGNGGNFAFDPPAVWVDPGTEITWEWTGKGGAHNVVAASGADFKSGSPTESEGTTFSQTLDSSGVVKYFCSPHKSLGMRGALVVGNATPQTTTAAAGYNWTKATFDAYWYSLYNMSTNIAMSGNGVIFPQTDEQKQTLKNRVSKMLDNADTDEKPIRNPNLNMVPFTSGDPSFTEKPVFSSENDDRPNADTLTWDKSKSSKVTSPAAVAWTHLKGVTWAKNFEKHFETLPDDVAAKFRAQVLATLAQLGIKTTLMSGGPDENGMLTTSDGSYELVSEFRPSDGTVVDSTTRPRQQAAMLWFLSDMVSLANGGWHGYDNPSPMVPAKKIQSLADDVFEATESAFTADDIVSQESTRSLGLMLGALGWYGTHAGSDSLQSDAETYADDLATKLSDNVDGNGKVSGGAANQAATQGIAAQGLAWASELDGIDYTDTADDVAGYMLDTLWDADAGTFASGENASTYTITARDAGDVTGGLNAADEILGKSGVQDTFVTYFQNTFNRGKLQRAERKNSRDPSAEYTLPLPPKAGGEFGQAAVYNAEVEYDTSGDSWSVTDDTFETEWALYLANQDVWIGAWAGDQYQGRGVPGESDTPP